ncbi:hypothetical protein [Pseudoduganella aquatica]|uniref:Uncharacterized protein n=1 Tax=Pseudoduganella aquatica TaxID=2660641 RepID=A0A7X4H762_9BURK|nr:hypothetical protein [Pseudoduganella aquatica]MYN05955.1 hypothetical protein [Pseudoduganella aquatica]
MRLHTSYAAERYGSPGGIAVGVSISIVLHVMLLYQSRFGWTPPAPVLPPRETITVWLRPAPVAPPMLQPLPPPRAALTVQAEPPPPKRDTRKERTARKPAPATSPEAAPAAEAPGMTWVAPAPASEAPAARADPFAEPAQAEAAPKFDMDAARRSARKVANERDPARAGTAVGQIPEKPLASETPLARKMSRAARADCKDGIPGGLLAPLLLAMDKKDHGCKW